MLAWIGAADRNDGKPTATPPRIEPPADSAPRRATINAKTLDHAFDAWTVGKKRDAVNKMTRALKLVAEAGIKAPMRELTRQDGLAFREHINTTLATRSGKTRSDILSNVQALLNFAVKERGWLDANPWGGTAIAKGRRKKRDIWDNDDLKKLFHAPLVEDRRLDFAAQYWIPLLSLYTGARQGDLCQLRVEDVLQRDGVWLIDINEDDGKSVKSDAGVRQVAIHSKLIQLGFIAHLHRMRDAGERSLFPAILESETRTAASYVSDWFRERCRALGLYRRWRDFHSFRTTASTALRALDPPIGEALITATMGHQGGNVGASHYHRPAPRTLQLVVEKLDFDAVNTLKKTELWAHNDARTRS